MKYFMLVILFLCLCLAGCNKKESGEEGAQFSCEKILACLNYMGANTPNTEGHMRICLAQGSPEAKQQLQSLLECMIPCRQAGNSDCLETTCSVQNRACE
jgi:hypothetical protein